MTTPGPSRPPGCTLAKLRSFLQSSTLGSLLRHFSATSNVVEVERHFRILMRGIKFWDLDRIQPLFSALCMLILIKDSSTDDLCYKRSGLMSRFLEFVDCVPPMIAHQLIEKLLENLAEYEVDSELSLLKLAIKLADISHRGRVLAVCLNWHILGRQLPALEITMHRFRDLAELTEAIRKKPPSSPSIWMADDSDLPIGTVQAKMESLRVMLEAMDRLLELLLSCENDDLQQEGYPENFFVLELKDSTFLSDWCIDLSKELPSRMCGPRGKFGAPLHAIIGRLMHYRESKVPDIDPLLVVEVSMEPKLPEIDPSLVLEVSMNVSD